MFKAFFSDAAAAEATATKLSGLPVELVLEKEEMVERAKKQVCSVLGSDFFAKEGSVFAFSGDMDVGGGAEAAASSSQPRKQAATPVDVEAGSTTASAKRRKGDGGARDKRKGVGAKTASAFSGDQGAQVATTSSDAAGDVAMGVGGAVSGELEDFRAMLKLLDVNLRRFIAGGEIPCHFTTLTTAIYHWQDLALVLEQYETQTMRRRGGRLDPLEPGEKKLSAQRRRVLRYPGVVAWYTAYKIELFYKHVLQYADGQGIFEWGAGGIMHLHSINFGERMPRVDPHSEEMKSLDLQSVAIARDFATVHEEYLTEWSLGKAEKWQSRVIENEPAKCTRRGAVGSPLHTDSESDGSEDIDYPAQTRKFQKEKETSGPAGVLAEDEDFVREYPSATQVVYVKGANGEFATVKLSASQKDLLADLDKQVVDIKWHPCSIGVAEKALFMTNNCALVRRARRKWYRRLTEVCNMHNRHGGSGLQVPAVFVEAPEEEEELFECERVQERVCRVRVCTQNMHMQMPEADFVSLWESYDVICLQEVTFNCLAELALAADQQCFSLESAWSRGRSAPEGFDVCILFRKSAFRVIQVSVVPMPLPLERCMLQALVQVLASGCLLAVATVHLTASRAEQSTRRRELKVCLSSLESLDVDACVLLGDLNMHVGENLPETEGSWQDGWVKAGEPRDLETTWELQSASSHVQSTGSVFRFDRILWLKRKTFFESGSRLTFLSASPEESKHDRPLDFDEGMTVNFVAESFNVVFFCENSDHAMVLASLDLMLASGSRQDLFEEHLRFVRPGLGPDVARRPKAQESCAKHQLQQVYCGKDYEKPRMQPKSGLISEDPRRRALFRLYCRRNCHHMNTHDPLKAIGLVANVDDQVVLTVQAAVNYLTKYLGKVGGGQTASGRIGTLIDDIVCRLPDEKTMTVVSLLSKLFIHAAVPEEVCSLEAWHILLDLPRALSSRRITTVSAKDTHAFKDINEIETSLPDQRVTKFGKLESYLSRMQQSCDDKLSPTILERMSFSAFVASVDHRGKRLSLRMKPNVVKEKPFLMLDARRRDAASMARMCLRLHRPFVQAAEDPMLLDDGDALEQLQAFVESSVCPVWLRDRFEKHNRRRRVPPPAGCVPFLATSEQDGSTHGDVSKDAADRKKRGKQNTVHVDGLLEDTTENRESVAAQHGLLWSPARGGHDMRFSVEECIASQRPVPKKLQLRAYCGVLYGGAKFTNLTVHALAAKVVFKLLAIDLQAYIKRGAGRVKTCLPKETLLELCAVHIQHNAKEFNSSQSKKLRAKPYAELWNTLKRRMLRECGLQVSESQLHRVLTKATERVDLQLLKSPERDGDWREQVFCIAPFHEEREEWDTQEERAEKRARYVQTAMQEQSMGRPGKRSQEVDLPIDTTALICADLDTRFEWDALNAFPDLQFSNFLREEVVKQLVPEVQEYTLKDGQGGVSQSVAVSLVSSLQSEGSAKAPQLEDLDPTQQSFVSHLRSWAEAFVAISACKELNSPLDASADVSDALTFSGGQRKDVDLHEPVLLLGTAGTGKTTTLQVANTVLGERGLSARIVRAAFTGVAASNMGSGARTLMSLFRLSRSKFSGALPHLEEEERSGGRFRTISFGCKTCCSYHKNLTP